MLETGTIREALDLLGELLADRGTAFDLVIIGGGALLLLGLIDRPTKDLDVVALLDESKDLIQAKPLPALLLQGILDVASALGLPDDWLKPGPASLLELGLPKGFLERVTTRQHAALTLRIASRVDHIAFKLYAAVDQGPDSKHFADLRQLLPTAMELLKAAQWGRTHDPSEGFRSMLLQALAALGLEDPDV